MQDVYKNIKEYKAFIDYSNDMQDVYKNIKEYNLGKKLKVSIVFDDIINNQKLNPVVTELFIRGGKLNISIVFITKNITTFTKKIIDFLRDYFYFYYLKLSTKQKVEKDLKLKILTPKQILQRLPTALAQVKAGNNSESL